MTEATNQAPKAPEEPLDPTSAPGTNGNGAHPSTGTAAA
jgi:hypothetical protein